MPLQLRHPEEGTSPVSLAEVSHWLTHPQIKTGTHHAVAVAAVPKAQGCSCLHLPCFPLGEWGEPVGAGTMLHPFSCHALAQLSLFEPSGDRDLTAPPAHSEARHGKYSPITQLDTSLVPLLGFLLCKELNVKGKLIFLFFSKLLMSLNWLFYWIFLEFFFQSSELKYKLLKHFPLCLFLALLPSFWQRHLTMKRHSTGCVYHQPLKHHMQRWSNQDALRWIYILGQ